MKKMRSLAFILALLSLLVTNVMARSYSPTTGRYIEFDPTGLDGGWNGYAYVSNDPLGAYDDNGLAEKKPTPSIAPASPIAGGGARGPQWRSLPPDLAPYKIPIAGGNGGAGAGRGMMGLPGCPPVYRGGTSLAARLGVDVKPAADGLIHPSGKNGKPQGLSLNLDPRDPFIQKYGGAFPVESLPDGLQALQSGQPGHFVVAPATPMSFEKYQQLLNRIQLGNFNALP